MQSMLKALVFIGALVAVLASEPASRFHDHTPGQLLQPFILNTIAGSFTYGHGMSLVVLAVQPGLLFHDAFWERESVEVRSPAAMLCAMHMPSCPASCHA